jgi:hypothetical protein
MALPRTFVGFSSTDIDSYRLMCAWKAHEHIDFNFCDCQLAQAVDSTNEKYIKRRCRARIDLAGTYVMLIGEDTRWKDNYVLWEVEVAIEKGCRLIGVNLDRWRSMNPTTCPAMFRKVDALFVPFSPHIVAHALENWEQPTPPKHTNFSYTDSVYQRLGYVLKGSFADRPRMAPFFGFKG